MSFKVAIILLLMAGTLLAIWSLFKEKKANKFLSYSLLVMFGMWYVFPVLFSMFKWELFGLAPYLNTVTYDTYLQYALWDLLFVFIVVAGVRLKIGLGKPRQTRIFGGTFQRDPFIIKVLWIFSFLILLVSILLSRGEYLYRNDVTNDPGIWKALGLLSTYAVSILIVFIVFQKKTIGKWFYYGAHVVIFTYSVDVLLGGARMYLLAPILICSYLFFFEYQSKKKIPLFLALLLLFYLSVTLLPVVGNIRTGGELNLDRIGKEVRSGNYNWNDVINEFAIKLNSTFYGAVLCEADGIGAAGIRPYVNSFLSIIPRFIYPDRPTPRSKDGTIYGYPVRLAASYLVGETYTRNVGVQPSQVALWHGGAIAFALNALFGIFFLVWINRWLNSGLIFAQTVGVLFLSIPTMEILMTFDLFLMEFPRIFFVYLAIQFSYTIGTFFFNFRKSMNEINE